MADLKLRMEGESSGATKAIGEVGDELTLLHRQATAQGDAQRKQSEEMWGAIAKYAAAAAAAVTAFGVASLKAFADAERVQRQLRRAAGEYTGVLEQQADALEVLLNADGDLIKEGQTLLAQWNGVGAASRETMQAILDYAAATGQDAVAATQELIRNVESGGTGLAKLGVHYDATGDKAEDLRRATAALAEKFGGAAAAEGESLYGQLRSVETAFDDVKEAIGGNIAEFLRQHDVAGKLTEALRGLQTLLGDGDVAARNKRDEEYLEDMERLNARLEHRKELAKQIADFEAIGARVAADGVRMLYAENEKGIGLIRMALEERRKLIYGDELPAAEGGPTNQKRQRDAAGRSEEDRARERSLTIAHGEFNREYTRKMLEQMIAAQDAAAKESIQIEQTRTDILKEETEQNLAFQEDTRQREKEMREAEERSIEMSIQQGLALKRRKLDEDRSLLEKQEQAWADAGQAIGSAFVTSLGRELERLMEGGDMDAGEVVANIIGDVLAVAGQVIGTAIGSAYGGPAGAQLGGAIGGAAGGLFSTGVKALGRAGRRSKYHDGGWVGAPRYHDGAWIGPDEQRAILQTGERVLSRSEVQAAGGPAAVDNMAAGGARFHFTIHTIDAQGTREFFENDGGRGFFNALRTGRGSLLPAFGGA